MPDKATCDEFEKKLLLCLAVCARRVLNVALLEGCTIRISLERSRLLLRDGQACLELAWTSSEFLLIIVFRCKSEVKCKNACFRIVEMWFLRTIRV